MSETNAISPQPKDEVLSPDHNCTFICHTRSWLENEKLVRHGGSLLVLGLLFWCTAFMLFAFVSSFPIFRNAAQSLSLTIFLFLGGGALLLLPGMTCSIYYGIQSRSLKARLIETLENVGQRESYLPTGEAALSREINSLRESSSFSKPLLLYSLFYLLIYLFYCMNMFSLKGSVSVFNMLLGPLTLSIFLLPCYLIHRYVGMIKGLAQRIEEKLPAKSSVDGEKEKKEAFALSELRRHSSIFWRVHYMSYIPLLTFFSAFALASSSVFLSIITGAVIIPLYLNGPLNLLLISIFLACTFFFSQILVMPIIWFLHWKMSKSQESVDNIFDGTLHKNHDVLQTLEVATERTLFKKYSSQFSFAALMSLFANLIILYKFHHLFAANEMGVVFTALMAAFSFLIWLQISNYLEGKNAQGASEMIKRLSIQKEK